jgi:hypothetical protein
MIDMGSLNNQSIENCTEIKITDFGLQKRNLGSKNGMWAPKTEFVLQKQNLGSKIMNQNFYIDNENKYNQRSIKHK